MKKSVITVMLGLLPWLLEAQDSLVHDTLPGHTIFISYQQTICFDSAVSSYKVRFENQGKIIEQQRVLPCYTLSEKLPPGTVLHFSELFYISSSGIKKMLEPRDYIVK